MLSMQAGRQAGNNRRKVFFLLLLDFFILGNFLLPYLDPVASDNVSLRKEELGKP